MRFCAASDQALLVYTGEEIGIAAHEQVMTLLRLLQKNRPAWLRNVQPGYCSLLVTFDPCLVDHDAVEEAIHGYLEPPHAKTKPRSPRKIVEIPVCYDEEFGPDLLDVAALHRITPDELIRKHCSRVYHAYFLGFVPGFAYLGDLPDELATPRLEIPRKQVPAGSVALAGKQTAIYPFKTPGGWRLLGRTPLRLFRTDRKPMSLVAIGDQVRFRPISRGEFSKWPPA